MSPGSSWIITARCWQYAVSAWLASLTNDPRGGLPRQICSKSLWDPRHITVDPLSGVVRKKFTCGESKEGCRCWIVFGDVGAEAGDKASINLRHLQSPAPCRTLGPLRRTGPDGTCVCVCAWVCVRVRVHACASVCVCVCVRERVCVTVSGFSFRVGRWLHTNCRLFACQILDHHAATSSARHRIRRSWSRAVAAFACVQPDRLVFPRTHHRRGHRSV